MGAYLNRYIEAQIERRLQSSGAVLLAGPKFCGKTTTAQRLAKSFVKLNTRQAIDLARMEPRNTLIGEQPRLIDEWQTVPDIWNEAKNWIDENPEFGQFILTGSATPADKTQLYHSGAGRITTIKMRPMSLFESGDSKGSVSLKSLFDDPDVNVFDENKGHELLDTAFLLCRGGWPLSLQKSRKLALDVTANYYQGLFNFDNGENGIFRNKKPEVMRMVLRSYARHISTEASYQTIIQDIIAANNRTMDPKTFDDYMDALRDLFIIEDIEAWNPNLRSKASVRTTPTRHFVDTSIACQALDIAPADLLNDLNTFGLFFEDMAVRDLIVYSMNLDGTVRHYRDSNGLECDAVIHLKDGRWALVEIKLGGEDKVNEGVTNLLKFRSVVDERNLAFSMVLTATGPAYRHKDGVFVVPINCLKD
ncbi:MAG: ATP-binding protein [Bacteroidales bacterium]|nr:ATP-binding protein [Bacteroidales bacterium]